MGNLIVKKRIMFLCLFVKAMLHIWSIALFISIPDFSGVDCLFVKAMHHIWMVALFISNADFPGVEIY